MAVKTSKRELKGVDGNFLWGRWERMDIPFPASDPYPGGVRRGEGIYSFKENWGVRDGDGDLSVSSPDGMTSRCMRFQLTLFPTLRHSCMFCLSHPPTRWSTCIQVGGTGVRLGLGPGEQGCCFCSWERRGGQMACPALGSSKKSYFV